jgi:hypothetical protein
MPVPVLIAARNESDNLGRTLDALPDGSVVEPYVIPNGCDDDGQTLAVAEAYAESHGVNVWESPVHGKLPSLQYAVERLGERATEPFVTLDADSYPFFPSKWMGTLRKARSNADADMPAVIGGPVLFTELKPSELVLRNAAMWTRRIQTRHDTGTTVGGSNMLLDFRKPDVAKDFLAMDHIWPGEDTAIKDLVLQRGGNFIKAFHPLALVGTNGDRFGIDMVTRIKIGREAARELSIRSYRAEAAPGSRDYAGRLVLKSETETRGFENAMPAHG